MIMPLPALPSIDLSNLGFEPTKKEMKEAKRVFRLIVKEFIEAPTYEERLKVYISGRVINERAKKLIHSQRIFKIVQLLFEQITYTKMPFN
jgi:hypothetical protein